MKYEFLKMGMMLSTATYIGNEALKFGHIDNLSNTGMIFGMLASIGGGFLLDQLYKENEYEKLFRMCGLENKDKKIPLIIKKEKLKESDNIVNLVVRLPEGISQSHFEKKQEELEQFLNTKIEFGFNKNLIIKLIYNNLDTMYPYEYKDCKKSSQAFCGIGHSDNFILDLEKDQHIIVAGESDSGKSSFLTSMILSYILSDKKIDLHLHDFQNITMGIFKDCKKVKSYTTTPEEFDSLLDKMEKECEKRLKLFRSVEKKVYIEKLESWNEEFPNKKLPYIFVIADEFATLADKEYEPILSKFRKRVAMDRKAGIHYLIAIQRPSADIIAGAIKANMSTRIAFKVVSSVDSEVILGGLHGAEKIKNQGRFLAKFRGQFKEYQAPYIKPKNIRKLLKDNNVLKTKEDIEAEQKQDRKKVIEEFHKNNLNPYRKFNKLV